MADGFKRMGVRSILIEHSDGVWAEVELRQDEAIISAESTSQARVSRVWIARKIRDI